MIEANFFIPPVTHSFITQVDGPLYRFCYEPEPHKGFGKLHVFRMELKRGVLPGEEKVFNEIKAWCRAQFGRQQGVLPGRWRMRNLDYVFTDENDAFAFKMRWF